MLWAFFIICLSKLLSSVWRINLATIPVGGSSPFSSIWSCDCDLALIPPFSVITDGYLFVGGGLVALPSTSALWAALYELTFPVGTSGILSGPGIVCESAFEFTDKPSVVIFIQTS